jgi:hypothetical protein
MRHLILTLAVLFSFSAWGAKLTQSETSYTGAQILTGGWDIDFDDFYAIGDPPEEVSPYAFFTGNTLYAGNSDVFGNTVDTIIEFFWFESSIDRGSDFYVAVIKVRATPGKNCNADPFGWFSGFKCTLWSDQWQDWGEHPVLSVQATTDTAVESGAFRWDWSLPFESYGIDAYGQVTLKSEYGLGVESEGAAMAHGEYKMDDDISWMAEGDIQVKGYADESYRVKTQYNVTLWEWQVFVDGRADLMAWDMYLNLSARDEQSAYHEFFLSIQVEDGKPFTMDELFVMGNFDVGWYNPWHRPLGVSIMPVTISRPSYAVDPPDIPPPHKPVEKEEITQNEEVQTSTQTEDNPKNQKPLDKSIISRDNLIDLGGQIIEVDVFEPGEEPVVVEQPTPTIIVEQGCSAASPTTPEKAKFAFMFLLIIISGALWLIGRKEK